MKNIRFVTYMNVINIFKIPPNYRFSDGQNTFMFIKRDNPKYRAIKLYFYKRTCGCTRGNFSMLKT